MAVDGVYVYLYEGEIIVDDIFVRNSGETGWCCGREIRIEKSILLMLMPIHKSDDFCVRLCAVETGHLFSVLYGKYLSLIDTGFCMSIDFKIMFSLMYFKIFTYFTYYLIIPIILNYPARG